MTKTEEELRDFLQKTVEDTGYILYDLMYVKESSDWYLRLFIDSNEKRIDLDDCEKVSNMVSDVLDEKDPIADKYNLEVSSCGLERHLREPEHFNWAIGKKILVKLYKPQNGAKEYEGELTKFEEKVLTLKVQDSDEIVTINFDDVASSKILYNWEDLENE